MAATTPALAQPDISNISLRAGLIRNLYSDLYSRFHPGYSFYPELQLGGSLVAFHLLNWALYFGYWDDGVDKAFPIADGITYSYDSLIIGARVGFMPGAHRKELPVQPVVFVGLSRHFMAAEYIGGWDFTGNIGRDFSRPLNYLEIGFRAQVRINRTVQAVLEIQQFRQFNENEWRFPKNRRAYKLGLMHSY